MFREIDAECYIMTDGDDTYPAKAAPEMVQKILERHVDMVVGDRLSSTYFTENKRLFHNFGNSLVRKSINIVKTFPVLSKGFEIETEMSIHAVDKNMFVENVVIDYRDRPDGSESKLNTYKDGIKVLYTIAKLYRVYRPLMFFSIISVILLSVATLFFVPVLIEFIQTRQVAKFPTLIVCGFTIIAAIQSFFAGLTLQTMVQKNKQDFENTLMNVEKMKKNERW